MNSLGSPSGRFPACAAASGRSRRLRSLRDSLLRLLESFAESLLLRVFLRADLDDRFLDRLEDLEVAGAAAEVSRDRLLDLNARRIRVPIEERLRREQDPRRAVAALRGA